MKYTVLFYLGKEEKMKRLFQVLLSLLLILCLFCPITALADTGGSGISMVAGAAWAQAQTQTIGILVTKVYVLLW